MNRLQHDQLVSSPDAYAPITSDHASKRRDRDSPVASQADEAICLFDEPSHIRWSHPLTAEAIQVVIGRPTGHRASLSDVDGDLVLPRLGEQVADRWHTKALQSLPDVRLGQLRCVSSKHESDGVTHLK